MVYDAPGSDLGFEDRYKALEKLFKNLDNPYITLVPHARCENMDHLKKELKGVLEKNGEGLMLRVPDAKYVPKRDISLLKVKTFFDEEATIIGHD